MTASRVYVLGIDPGPTRCGWAFASREGGRFIYRGGGLVASTVAALDALLAAHPSGLVGLEVVEGYAFAQARSSALVATSAVAGILEGLAKGRQLVKLSAASWRRIVLGLRSPTDAQIKEVVGRLVDGLPTRTNAHVRDALGVAIAASWTTRLRRAA